MIRYSKTVKKLHPLKRSIQTLASLRKGVKGKRKLLQYIWDDFKPTYRRNILPALKRLKKKP